MEKRKCGICGKEFEPYNSNQKFCTPECANENHKRKAREKYRKRMTVEPRKCPYCGKEFVTSNHKKTFCSEQCAQANWKAAHKKPAKPKKPMTTRKCLTCGKEFTPARNCQKYCSPVCRKKTHWGVIEREQQCTCQRCGKKFTSVWKKKLCEACATKKYVEKKITQVKVDAATGKPVKTLSDWSREAAECNLDYGKYRALIESGKTYEELKAQADSRSTPNHAHGRIRKAD